MLDWITYPFFYVLVRYHRIVTDDGWDINWAEHPQYRRAQNTCWARWESNLFPGVHFRFWYPYGHVPPFVTTNSPLEEEHCPTCPNRGERE